MGVADDDAFAGGEAVGFDDDGDGEAGELLADFVERGAEGVGGGGDVVALHELFGEGLAGLEARGVLGGAEDAEVVRCELVDDAEGEGELGADDGEGGLLEDDDVDHGLEVLTSTGTQRASWAMPPLPGAQTTSVTRGDLRSAQTSACSRPPPPITKTFIDFQRSIFGRGGIVPPFVVSQSSGGSHTRGRFGKNQQEEPSTSGRR